MAASPKLQCPGKEITLDYYSDSEPDYYYSSDSSDYEFDFGLDMSEEKPLSGPAQGLVITSTSEGRFVYWPDQKPLDLADDDNS